MTLRIPGEIVSSHFVDLGEVDPGWIDSEAGKNMYATTVFETGPVDMGEAVEINRTKSIQSAPRVYYTATEDDPSEALEASLQAITSELDRLYRSFRGISDTTVLRHDVDYRCGRLRLSASNFHSILGNMLPFSTPGYPHFDDFIGQNRESIMLSAGGGVGSRMFTGPIWKLHKNAVYGGVARLSAPRQEILPHNHAILYDSNTLHQQAGQFYNPFNPGVFFRTIIGVELEE